MDRLTNRQQEIASLVVQGLSNKSIARQLGIAEGTVKVQLNTIFRILNVISRFQLLVKLMGEHNVHRNS